MTLIMLPNLSLAQFPFLKTILLKNFYCNISYFSFAILDFHKQLLL